MRIKAGAYSVKPVFEDCKSVEPSSTLGRASRHGLHSKQQNAPTLSGRFALWFGPKTTYSMVCTATIFALPGSNSQR